MITSTAAMIPTPPTVMPTAPARSICLTMGRVIRAMTEDVGPSRRSRRDATEKAGGKGTREGTRGAKPIEPEKPGGRCSRSAGPISLRAQNLPPAPPTKSFDQNAGLMPTLLSSWRAVSASTGMYPSLTTASWPSLLKIILMNSARSGSSVEPGL
jgi:hypothetical protein